MIDGGQVVHLGSDFNLVGHEVYKYDHANKQAEPSRSFYFLDPWYGKYAGRG